MAVRIGEERHPKIVVIHLRDQLRRVCERLAALRLPRTVIPEAAEGGYPGPIPPLAQAAPWVPGLASLARDDRRRAWRIAPRNEHIPVY
jgi:hypothetical protein